MWITQPIATKFTGCFGNRNKHSEFAHKPFAVYDVADVGGFAYHAFRIGSRHLESQFPSFHILPHFPSMLPRRA